MPSPNFGPRPAATPIDLVVLHSISLPPGEYGGDSVERLFTNTLDWSAHPYYEKIRGLVVSAHFFVRRDGALLQFVSCDERAWHAGAGSWQGREDVNSRSIGIELANPGDRPFPEPQMAALESLLRGIMARWDIGPAGVIAHSDMAPGRKADPGPRFDWRRLALGGLALWPEGLGEDRPLADSLPRIGYPDSPAALSAFRLRFRPWATGPETEDDRRAAAALAYSMANKAESLAASASSP